MKMESCLTCKHQLGWSREKRSTVCKAFPNGIPLGVLSGDVQHTEHLPGDHGFEYELITDEEIFGGPVPKEKK